MMPAVLAIEIRHLRHVIAAADHHSFRKAAEALRLKQSTLSRSIRQMEDQLGVALFERNAAGVRPTQAGTDLLRAARCLVEDFQMMLSHAWNAGEGRAGQIAIGFYGSLAGGSLRATVLDYNRRCPAVKLLLTESARGRLLKGLKSGALDVAIVSGDLNQLSSQTMTLWSERVFVALSQDHLLASRNVISWTDLREEVFLLSERDPGRDIHDLLIAKLVAPGSRPKIQIYDIGSEHINGLVGAGLGVTLMGDACLTVRYEGVVYREVRDGNGPSRISYCAVWNDRNANPALKSFLGLLRERYPVNTSH